MRLSSDGGSGFGGNGPPFRGGAIPPIPPRERFEDPFGYDEKAHSSPAGRAPAAVAFHLVPLCSTLFRFSVPLFIKWNQVLVSIRSALFRRVPSFDQRRPFALVPLYGD